jgi:SAM-dependent methyltransferase
MLGGVDDRARAIEINRANWDCRVGLHAASEEYGLRRFVDDPSHLSEVVRFDLPRLGDVRGLRGAHLQCHIGTDTVSLARLGADMTGLDFSAPALDVARRLAADAGPPVRFVQAEVYSAVEALGAGGFDLVFTGVGALCWLPDVDAWAANVAGLLRPGGRLFLREGHPMLWALDDPRDDGLVAVEYPYFELTEGTEFRETKTYVEHDDELASPTTVQWNHGLGQVITALMVHGMQLTALEEHDSVPWPALGDQMDLLPNGEYRLRDRPWRLAHSYTLQAVRA